MSSDNNNNQENINTLNTIINDDISIKTKNLIKKLLQNTIGNSLLKLESNTKEEFSTLKIISKNFDDFSKKIKMLQKKFEENLKKKERGKIKKLSIKNEKKIRNNNNKDRPLSSNSNKISFNKKRSQTITNEEENEKNNNGKNPYTNERGKYIRSNKMQLRTISNFKNIQIKEKEKSKEKEIKIETSKNKAKINEITNLKKYKTSINKNLFRKGLTNQNENFNTSKTNNKKNELNSTHNDSVKSNKINKGINYSYDKKDENSLSDIEEKIERKVINNQIVLRKNKFKEKEVKNYILINKNKVEHKNDKKGNFVNKKNTINIENINSKKDLNIDNIINSNSKTISNDLEIKYSKSNNIKNIKNNFIKPLSQESIHKRDLQIISVENIVKLVDDVNQSINKILDGSQGKFQRRNSIKENSRSFIINKNTEIHEFLNKSPEINHKKQEKIKEYNDIPNSNRKNNLNLKCKINYNIFSNDIESKKNSRKIKIPNSNSNKSNLTSSINTRKIGNKEKELTNFNSFKDINKKSIKKFFLKSEKNKIKESEKNNDSNEISIKIIKGKKLNESIQNNSIENKNIFKVGKKNNLCLFNLIKNNPKILSNILQYLSFENKLYFLSINKDLTKERKNLLINKREEIILILQLKENETIDNKIQNLKNNYKIKEPIEKEFKLSKNCIKNLKQLNDNHNTKLFKEKKISKNKITEINIIYRILLLLFGEKKLVEISDDNIFWKKFCKYFLEKNKDGKLGNFIISLTNNFSFEHRTINLIESILIGNKNNIINGYYEKLCKTTGLIIPLIKEALIYCGIIKTETNYISNQIIDNLQFNKRLINKLNVIINSDPNI